MLFQLVSLLLYAGPLFAGLAGHGWTVLPAFAAIFILWQVFLRPADWPRDSHRWRQADAWVGALTRIALIVVLVAVIIAVGRGVGGALGYLPGIPLAAPLALSFLSIPLARLLWDPASGVPLAAFAGPNPRRVRDDVMHDTIRPLLDLPPETQDGTAQAAVARLGDSPMAANLLASLTVALTETPSPATPVRRGLILWATEPALAPSFRGEEYLMDAWAVAEGRDDLLRLFAVRARALLAADPGSRPDLPSVAEIAGAARGAHDPDTAKELAALSAALRG